MNTLSPKKGAGKTIEKVLHCTRNMSTILAILLASNTIKAQNDTFCEGNPEIDKEIITKHAHSPLLSHRSSCDRDTVYISNLFHALTNVPESVKNKHEQVLEEHFRQITLPSGGNIHFKLSNHEIPQEISDIFDKLKQQTLTEVTRISANNTPLQLTKTEEVLVKQFLNQIRQADHPDMITIIVPNRGGPSRANGYENISYIGIIASLTLVLTNFYKGYPLENNEEQKKITEYNYNSTISHEIAHNFGMVHNKYLYEIKEPTTGEMLIPISNDKGSIWAGTNAFTEEKSKTQIMTGFGNEFDNFDVSPMNERGDVDIMNVNIQKLLALNGKRCPSNETTPTNESSFSDGLKLYPNPTSGQLEITLPQFAQKQGRKNPLYYSVINTIGQVVSYQEITQVFGGSTQLDISQLPNGIYAIKIRDTKGNQATTKVVIEK